MLAIVEAAKACSRKWFVHRSPGCEAIVWRYPNDESRYFTTLDTKSYASVRDVSDATARRELRYFAARNWLIEHKAPGSCTRWRPHPALAASIGAQIIYDWQAEGLPFADELT